MTTKEFIEKAIEGGWKSSFKDKDYDYEGSVNISKGDAEISLVKNGNYIPVLETININDLFLDPKAWEAVGKVERWESFWEDCPTCNSHCKPHLYWENLMHQMIGDLIEGGSIESYLKTL